MIFVHVYLYAIVTKSYTIPQLSLCQNIIWFIEKSLNWNISSILLIFEKLYNSFVRKLVLYCNVYRKKDIKVTHKKSQFYQF